MKFDAVVFPGQGAQKIGMAKDFVASFKQAADVFEMANQVLPFDIYEVCHVNETLINQTKYTQAAILVAEIAMYESLKHEYGLRAHYFAGHSLGEYTALTAAGVLSFEVALKLVVKRGELMHSATTDGAMTAVIMDEVPCQDISTLIEPFGVDVANDNSVQQLVLSGQKQALDSAVSFLTQHYQDVSFRVVPLAVSSAFHSRWMEPIEKLYHQFIQEFRSDIDVAQLPQVASNYLGGFYRADKDDLLSALANQISGRVKWRSNMQLLQSMKVLEIGPNRPLRGFFKSIGNDITSVINVKSAAKAFAV